MYAVLDEKHKREWNYVNLKKQVGKAYRSSVYKYLWKCSLDTEAVSKSVIISFLNSSVFICPDVDKISTDFQRWTRIQKLN